MTLKTTVGLTGFDEISAKLEELGGNVRGVHRAAGRKVLKPFDQSWRGKVREKTGALKNSGGIGTKLSRRQRKEHTKTSEVELHAGPGPLTQAITEEFGTHQQAAHPAVRPAWDETKDQIPGALGEIYWAEIERTVKRRARKAAKAAAALEDGEG